MDFDDFQDPDEPKAGTGAPIPVGGLSQPSETIDLDNLFSKDLTSSGSFDFTALKKTGFAKLLMALPTPALLIDKSYSIAFCNEAWGRISSTYPKLEGVLFTDFLPDSEQGRGVRSLLDEVYRERRSKIAEGTLLIDNKRIWTRMSIRPLRLSTERFILVLVEDLTMERRQILLMDTIRRAKQEWELTFDTVTDLICTIDHRYRVLRLNRAMADKVGIPIRDGVGQACYKLVHGSSAPPPFCPYPKAFSAGREASVEYFEEQLGAYLSESLCPIRGEPGHPIGCVLVTRDISERKELENQLQFRATRDALTGLLNRSHFLELLKAAFETAKRYVHPLSVCIADIDLFKAINDQHGHKAGDAVLVRFSQILLSELRQSDLSARYGGDEFIIALPHTPARKAAESMDRLRKGLEAVHFESGSRSWTATCSVGVAEFSARAMNIESLIAEADRALYEAKNRGRNRVVVLVG